MISIKKIDDKDYNKLLKLYQDYQSILPTKHKKFISSKLLNDELMATNSIAFGLYKNDNLVGFIIGYIHNDTFMLSSMYVEKNHRYHVKKLLDYMENHIKTSGCLGWRATGATEKSRAALKTYGAKPIEIIYYKEI